MFNITRIEEVANVLASIDHKLATQWLVNEMIKKTLAISYDYWLEDTDIPMTLKDFVTQYLEHAEDLGEIFSSDTEIDDPSC
ncbi:hypothetical protein V7152_20430 [Neobacillus drentensis]|uniref:hypothetical protein n=1 Tax=Neobacillus drentensis TaxID=220684 RepID=UPI002FFFE983